MNAPLVEAHGLAAGVAGLYPSHHLSVAAGGAVALALCAAAAVGAALPVSRTRPCRVGDEGRVAAFPIQCPTLGPI